MKRPAAAAVVSASAVAGVVLGVVVASASQVGSHAQTEGRPAVVSPGTITSASSPVASGDASTNPTPATTTASTATTTKATSTTSSTKTHATTAPTIPAAAAKALMQVSDFGQAGWSTTALERTVAAEAEESDRIACLQGKLGDLANARWAVTATFQGRSISAVETVADYGTPAQADAAVQAVRGWVQGCTAYLSTSSFRVTVGGGGTHPRRHLAAVVRQHRRGSSAHPDGLHHRGARGPRSPVEARDHGDPALQRVATAGLTGSFRASTACGSYGAAGCPRPRWGTHRGGATGGQHER